MTKKKGKNLKYLRESNKDEILKFLTVNNGGSRIELSKQLGLSKMTITNIVSELMEADYLTEKKDNTKKSMSTTGPKPMMLSIKRERLLAIGVYISRESIQCSLSDIVHGDIFFTEEKIEKKNILKTFVGQILNQIRKILAFDTALNQNIIGIGISTVGLVDSERGVLVRCTDFLGIEQFDIMTELKKNVAYPIFISNHNQASALAEQLYGQGKSYSDFLYLGISQGVGAAEVTGGKLMVGSRGFAVEAGHMSLNYQGELCSCGNRGCLELYVGIPALLNKTNSKTIDEMVEKYRRGEARTLMTMEEFTRIMGIALTNLSNVFDPSCIIIGHEGAVIAEMVLPKIERLVNIYSLQKLDHQVKVYVSSFKEFDAIRGAAALVFNNLFIGKISLPEQKEE